MSDDLKYLDELFRHELKEIPVESTPQNIHAFGKRLGWFRFFRFNIMTFNIWYAAVISCGLFVSGYFIIPDNSIPEKNHKQYMPRDNEEIFINKESDSESGTMCEEVNEDGSAGIPDVAGRDESFSGSLKNRENKTGNNTLPEDEGMNDKTTKTTTDNRTTAPCDSLKKQTIFVHDTVIVTKKVIVTDTVTKVIHREPPKRNR
ncbi:MAG: hypothetical protein ABIJ16_14545 [Bacteroidota bacterium]